MRRSVEARGRASWRGDPWSRSLPALLVEPPVETECFRTARVWIRPRHEDPDRELAAVPGEIGFPTLPIGKIPKLESEMSDFARRGGEGSGSSFLRSAKCLSVVAISERFPKWPHLRAQNLLLRGGGPGALGCGGVNWGNVS